MPGAHNAVNTCLAIQPRERVALIADEASREVAASLEQALAERGARAECLLIESVSARPMLAAPPQVIELLERVDAGVLCVQPQEGELAARMAIVAAVERRRIRYAHMVGVTPQIMCEGMRADYTLVDRLSQELCARMQTARSLSVRLGRWHRLRRHLRSIAGLGEDEWSDQSALLVEPAGWRGVHHAGIG